MFENCDFDISITNYISKMYEYVLFIVVLIKVYICYGPVILI